MPLLSYLQAQGVTSLATATQNDGIGLRWEKRFDDSYFSLNDVFKWFIIDFFIYLILALTYDFFFGKEDARYVAMCVLLIQAQGNNNSLLLRI